MESINNFKTVKFQCAVGSTTRMIWPITVDADKSNEPITIQGKHIQPALRAGKYVSATHSGFWLVVRKMSVTSWSEAKWPRNCFRQSLTFDKWKSNMVKMFGQRTLHDVHFLYFWPQATLDDWWDTSRHLQEIPMHERISGYIWENTTIRRLWPKMSCLLAKAYCNANTIC